MSSEQVIEKVITITREFVKDYMVERLRDRCERVEISDDKIYGYNCKILGDLELHKYEFESFKAKDVSFNLRGTLRVSSVAVNEIHTITVNKITRPDETLYNIKVERKYV